MSDGGNAGEKRVEKRDADKDESYERALVKEFKRVEGAFGGYLGVRNRVGCGDGDCLMWF